MSVVRPLLFLILALILVSLFSVILTANRSDEATFQRESRQIQGSALQYLKEFETAVSVLSAPMRSDAQNSAVVTTENFQAAIHQPLNLAVAASETFLFDASGHVLAAARVKDEGSGLPSDRLFEAASRITDASQVGDMISLDGDIMVVATVDINCDTAAPCRLVAASMLDRALSPRLEDGFQIGPFQATVNRIRGTGVYSAPIRNHHGDAIGWYHWKGWRPGRAFLSRYLPWLSLSMLGALATGWLVWRRTRRIAEGLTAAQEAANHRALHDPLTGLANRALLTLRMEEALRGLDRGHKGFAVHLIDLDNFKNINDTMGHQAGDDLISQVAERLLEVCRTGDTVARLGGDEFAIVQLDVSSPSGVARLARRTLEKLSAKFILSGSEVYVSGSIGVTICNETDTTQAELTRQADIALYRAKANGRNQFCYFEPEMDRSLKQKRVVETDLRTALAEGQLKVVYQPQVSADGRFVRGMEALVRWAHPERGMVSPASFIPVAEETGLIRPLGEYVMREAFKTAHKWPDITMAVNVSASELHQECYSEQVAAIARECGVRPDQIELEITETVLLENSARVTRTIKALKAAGFKIALDDFGTGYSSLSYLRRHQVDKLKIDQSFVSSIGVRDDAGAVVQAIIHLGEALGLTVTAEGVETEVQRDALMLQGCAYLQGYLFSRPLDADQIGDLLKMFSNRPAIAV